MSATGIQRTGRRLELRTGISLVGQRATANQLSGESLKADALARRWSVRYRRAFRVALKSKRPSNKAELGSAGGSARGAKFQ
jgi:hypothetical protein